MLAVVLVCPRRLQMFVVALSGCYLWLAFLHTPPAEAVLLLTLPWPMRSVRFPVSRRSSCIAHGLKGADDSCRSNLFDVEVNASRSRRSLPSAVGCLQLIQPKSCCLCIMYVFRQDAV